MCLSKATRIPSPVHAIAIKPNDKSGAKIVVTIGDGFSVARVAVTVANTHSHPSGLAQDSNKPDQTDLQWCI